MTVVVSRRPAMPLTLSAERSWELLDHLHMSYRGPWVVFFSGGKDSTALSLVLARWSQAKPDLNLTILYIDTRIEPPPMHEGALITLEQLRVRYGVGVVVRRPIPQESFWTLLLGKGYPPPHRKFRWCTDKLKLRPSLRYLKKTQAGLALVGSRLGESAGRTHRLSVSCNVQTGECGTGSLATTLSTHQMPYAAPLLHWNTEDVWDYLQTARIQERLELDHLFDLYGGGDLRFGCWTCSLVKKDRSGMALLERGHHVMAPLLAYRSWLIEEAAKTENRYLRQNGIRGRLTLAFRQKAFEQLKHVETKTGQRWLIREEETLIQRFWKDPRYGPYL